MKCVYVNGNKRKSFFAYIYGNILCTIKILSVKILSQFNHHRDFLAICHDIFSIERLHF